MPRLCGTVSGPVVLREMALGAADKEWSPVLVIPSPAEDDVL